MKVVGLGIDVVETARIKHSLDRFGERFLHRVFLPAEIEYCHSMKRPELHLAARFAAKEAISKAFGTGIGRHLGWHDAEIGRHPNGAPFVILSDKGRELASRRGANAVLVSLSHTDHYAAANALLVATENGAAENFFEEWLRE